MKIETEQENQFYVTDAKVLGTILYSSKITLGDIRGFEMCEKLGGGVQRIVATTF